MNADRNPQGLNERADELIEDLRSVSQPKIFIISGPSGVGKDAVIELMRERYPELAYIVTATTRQRRPGEIDGVHYYFIDENEFLAQVEQGDFFEHSNVYGKLYGVPKQRMRTALRSGKSVVLKVDVQGARTIKDKLSGAILIFISPQNMAQLGLQIREHKLREFDDVIRRLSTATHELTAARYFDYVVFNEKDQLEETIDAIATIIEAEDYRINQPEITL